MNLTRLATHLALAALTAVPPATAQQRPFTPSPLAWPELTRDNKPWTRWWWLGSAVDKTNLTRELERYHDAGLGGVHIIPIYGVKGGESNYIRYLSPQWMEMLRHTVTEQERRVAVDFKPGALALQGSQGLSGLAVSIDDALAAIDGAAPAQSSGAAWPALTGARRALAYVGQLGRDEGIELSAALLRSLQFLLAEHDPAADPGRWREAPIATRGPAHGEPARRRLVPARPDLQRLRR